jgi:hypothetical protein
MNQHFSPVIERWPDLTQFASDVGCKINVCREWVRTDSIPGPWFAAVTRAARTRGWLDVTEVHLAHLAELKRQQRFHKRAEAA